MYEERNENRYFGFVFAFFDYVANVHDESDDEDDREKDGNEKSVD